MNILYSKYIHKHVECGVDHTCIYFIQFCIGGVVRSKRFIVETQIWKCIRRKARCGEKLRAYSHELLQTSNNISMQKRQRKKMNWYLIIYCVWLLMFMLNIYMYYIVWWWSHLYCIPQMTDLNICRLCKSLSLLNNHFVCGTCSRFYGKIYKNHQYPYIVDVWLHYISAKNGLYELMCL